jgi:hypothetical protein
MSDEDYLWDKSGEPAPDVAHLENLLAALRWSGRQPASPGRMPANWWPRNRAWLMAAAALITLGLGAAFVSQKLRVAQPLLSWQLSLAGKSPSSVRSGQIIETGLSNALMESASIGEVQIDPNSRLRLLAAAQQDQSRLALDHGTIHAFIWAPPTKFVVDTPSAKAVDLGCQYTLTVDKDGKGMLTVETGWVAFQWKGLESFIPEGAACTTRAKHGPDTPYFLDAPEVLTKSLAEFDRTGNTQAMRAVLTAARPRDALTLWHLLERTHGSARAEVFDRFAELVKLPPGIERAAILRGDRESLDAAWDALQLGDTSWWREWKRNWR